MWMNFKPSLIIFCTLIYMIVSLRLMDWYTCTGVRRGSSKSKNNCSVPWFQVHILHKMVSLVLRFNLLRNNIRTSCPVRFLKQHAGFSSGKLLQPKSYEKRHFATNLTGQLVGTKLTQAIVFLQFCHCGFSKLLDMINL